MSKEQTKYKIDARVRDNGSDYYVNIESENDTVAKAWGATQSEAFARAELISDSFNVLEETNLTPSQLHHENKKLSDELMGARLHLTNIEEENKELKEQGDELVKSGILVLEFMKKQNTRNGYKSSMYLQFEAVVNKYSTKQD